MRSICLLAVLIASGCAAPATCTSDGRAEWVQPGLYAALPPEGSYEGVDVLTGSFSEGLPFDNLTLRERFGAFVLFRVSWNPASAGSDGRRDEFTLDSGPSIRATILSNGTDNARDFFLEFARNVTAADEERTQEWAQTFEASKAPEPQPAFAGDDPSTATRDSRVEAYVYRVAVPGPFRLETLWNETASARGSTPTPSASSVQSDGWRFVFLFESKQLLIRGAGETMKTHVSADDHISFNWYADGRLTQETFRQNIEQTFDRLRLPAPSVDEDQLIVVERCP